MAQMYPIFSQYVGIDAVLRNVQTKLLGEFGWLNDAFGRTERRERDYNGRKMRVQCVYTGVNRQDYLEMSPDAQIGNYSFFVLRDPQSVEWKPNIRKEINQPFSLILWFNITEIMSNSDGRNIEAVKQRVLSLLDGCRYVGSHFSVASIYEDAQNIWRNVTDIKDLDMWHPYAGLRFDGVVSYLTDCTSTNNSDDENDGND